MQTDGTYTKLTPAQFAKALKRFPKAEQDFILAQRKMLGIDLPHACLPCGQKFATGVEALRCSETHPASMGSSLREAR